jgi:hypothetical protein
MNKLVILMIFPFISCNLQKLTGSDYSLRINNVSSDTVYFGWDVNYDQSPKKGLGVKYIAEPNVVSIHDPLYGSWEGLFRSENDTLLVYFVDKATEKISNWDSIFTQNKYIALKKMSQSQFINSNKTMVYP